MIEHILAMSMFRGEDQPKLRTHFDETLILHSCDGLFVFFQRQRLPNYSSPVSYVTCVLVQVLYLMELPYKTAVTTSMVVDWVVLVLELLINRMVLKDVRRALLVSQYLLQCPAVFFYKLCSTHQIIIIM